MFKPIQKMAENLKKFPTTLLNPQKGQQGKEQPRSLKKLKNRIPPQYQKLFEGLNVEDMMATLSSEMNPAKKFRHQK